MITGKMNKLAMAMGAAAVLWCAAACSMGDQVENGGSRNRGLTPVRFTSGSSALVQSRNAGPVEPGASAWAGDELIGIYMLNNKQENDYALETGNISESVNNRKYEKKGNEDNSFEPAEGSSIIYYPVNGDVKFIAYHPYHASVDNFKSTLDLSDQSSQSAIDVLYAPTTGTAYNKDSAESVELSFEHKLVKLEFKIGKDEASVAASLAGLTVTITGQATEGTLDLTDGTVETTNSEQITAKTDGDGEFAEAIVFPSEDNSLVKFKFKNTEDEEFTGAVPTSKWIAGKKYTYTVTLQKTEATITGTVSPWDNGNDDGEAITSKPTNK